MPVELSGGDQSLYWRAGIDDSPYIASIRRMESLLFGFSQNVEQQGTELETFFKRAAVAASGFFSLQAGRNFIEQMIRVRGEFQDITSAFETMLGSKEKADQLMSEATKLAATTPFGLTDVASGAKQLLAYGFAADGITQNLTTLGNVAAGVKAPLGDLIYLYGTLKASGRVTQTDINQFAGRGIPIYEALAKVMSDAGKGIKVTEDQVRGLVTASKIGFPEIEKAFQSMTSQGGKFFDLMQKQSQNLTGRISNLGDAFDQMLNSLGQQNEGIFFSAIETATTLVTNYEKVFYLLGELVIAYGSYKAAQIAFIAYTKLQGLAAAGVSVEMALLRGTIDLHTKATLLLNSAQVQSVAALAGITIALTTVVFTIRSVIAEYDHLHTVQKQISDITAQASGQLQEQKLIISDQIGVIKSHNSTQEERAKALQKIIDLNPSILSGLNLQNVSTKEGTDLIGQYIDKLNDKLVAEAAYQTKLENLKKANDIRARGYDALSGTEITGAILNDIVTGGLFKSDHQNRVVDDYAKVYEDANKKIDATFKKQLEDRAKSDKKTDDAHTTSVQRNKAYWDKIIKDATDALSSLDELSPDFDKKRAKLIATIQDAKLHAAKFDPKTDAANLNQDNSFYDKQKAIYDKLGTLEAERLSNAKTADQREVDQVKARYKAILDEANKYNIDVDRFNKKNPGNKQAPINAGFFAQVNAISGKAQDDTRAQQKLSKEKELFNAQKQIYVEYENYKTEFGNKAANERFTNELKGATNYVQYLENLERENKGKTGAYASALTDFLSKELPKARIEQSKQNFDYLTGVLADTQSYQQKLDALNDAYDKKALTAALNGNEENVRIVNQQREQAVNGLKETQAQKIAVIQKYNDHIIQLTRAEAENQLKTLKEVQANSNLTPEQNGYIEQNVEKLKTALSSLNGLSRMYTADLKDQKLKLEEQLKILTPYSEKWNEIFNKIAGINALLDKKIEPDQFGQTIIPNDTSKKAQKIAAYAKEIQASFSELGNAIAPYNEGLGDTLSTIGEIAGVAGNAASSFASFASGDIVGGISSAISAISGVFSIFGKAKESARKAAAELQEYQDGLIRGEVALNQLLRERARNQQDINKLTSQELKDRQAMLKLQSSQAQSDYNRLLSQIQNSGQQITGEHTEKYGGVLGIGRKTRVVQDLAGLSGADYDKLEALYTKGALTDATKKWFEELQKAKQELDTIGESAQEAADQMNRIVTGTTAADIASVIADGFASGKRDVKDFFDYFDDMMQKGLLSKFENDFLKGKVDEFYKQYTAASAADGGLTAAKIAELKASYAEVIASASKEIENIEKVTGTSLTSKTSSGANSNSLEGSIKASITEETGSIVAGTTRGIQISAIKIVELQTYANNVQEKILGVTDSQASQMMAEAQTRAQRHSEVMGYWTRNLELATKIEANTFRTADNTGATNDRLDKVNKNLEALTKAAGAGNATLAANGKI